MCHYQTDHSVGKLWVVHSHPSVFVLPPCRAVVSVQLVQDTKDNSIGIGWESASGYWYHTGKAMSHVDVYARTMRNGADEQRPVWGDCQLAYNLMRQACINIVDWQCELRWGNCKKNWGSGGDCKWASCIYTTFFAPSVCINGITAGATGGGDKNGPSGSASVSFGLTPIDRVVAGAFGKPTCNAW